MTVNTGEQGDDTTDEQFAATVGATFAVFNDRRFGDFAPNMLEDVVESYPQSGESLVGRELQQAFHEAFPQPADLHHSQRAALRRPGGG